MKKLIVAIIAVSFLFFTACDNSKVQKGDDSEVVNDENDNEINDLENDVTEPDETGEDSADEDVNDADADFVESLQTGGVVIFSSQSGDKKNMFSSKTILGQGGFFGYSIFSFNDEYWGIGALHESVPPYDFEKATGKLYIFKRGKLPETIGDAQFVLTHPDLTINAGFSFTAAGTCDINKDGFDDIVVSSHLASYGTAYAAGELVVFYGSEDGWSEENSSISRLSEKYIQQSDCISQSLVCGDIDGDGYDDVMAGGQNAGPNLDGGGSPGMVAFFRGSAEGLEENEYWVLTPLVEAKAQYFGSSMILEDINGDDQKDLIVAGWGLKESEEADNTGGIYIYYGGADWQKGPSETEFGTKDSQFGSVIKMVEVGGKKGIGVLAPNESLHGNIYFFGAFSSPLEVQNGILPSDSGAFSDFETVNGVSNYDTLVVAGGKYFFGGGGLLCAGIGEDYAFEWEICPWQPDGMSGGFGYSVKNIGDINGDNRVEIVVGMPEYIQTLVE
ncbi:MAG TPA: integrin alpha [bacterium]|nr:integrin alpha [bacterium]